MSYECPLPLSRMVFISFFTSCLSSWWPSLLFVLRQNPHFLQSKQQIRLRPTRLIVWKQLQQEAHTKHQQASDVRRSSLRPIRWTGWSHLPQLRVLTLISAVICIIILKCIMSIFFPPHPFSRAICHINTHKFPRLSSSNWYLIGHLVNVSLLWLVWFLFPAQGWHWNRTFPPCTHSSILPKAAFSKLSSSVQLVPWARLSCDIQKPWDSSMESNELCQAGIPYGLRNNVITGLVLGSVNICLNKTADI